MMATRVPSTSRRRDVRLTDGCIDMRKRIAQLDVDDAGHIQKERFGNVETRLTTKVGQVTWMGATWIRKAPLAMPSGAAAWIRKARKGGSEEGSLIRMLVLLFSPRTMASSEISRSSRFSRIRAPRRFANSSGVFRVGTVPHVVRVHPYTHVDLCFQLIGC